MLILLWTICSPEHQIPHVCHQLSSLLLQPYFLSFPIHLMANMPQKMSISGLSFPRRSLHTPASWVSTYSGPSLVLMTVVVTSDEQRREEQRENCALGSVITQISSAQPESAENLFVWNMLLSQVWKANLIFHLLSWLTGNLQAWGDWLVSQTCTWRIPVHEANQYMKNTNRF